MRYEVTAIAGHLEPHSGGNRLPGASYSVIDTLWNRKLLATYRSEDYPGLVLSVAVRHAEQAARRHADTLNGCAEPLPPVTIKRRPIAKPQAHWSFRPTCPRCCVICPVGARDCPECGAFLYLTDDELAEL